MPLSNRSAAAAKLPTGNSAITNSPLSRWSGNTATGRRVRDLYRGYALLRGNPTDTATQALVLAAAEAVAIAENARRDHLAGKVDLNTVVRAEGMAARALRRIGMNKITPPPRKSFIEKMQEQEAARQAEALPAADAPEGANEADDSDQPISEAAQRIVMTPGQAAEHRRSFVYGNCSIANADVTREIVAQVDDRVHGNCSGSIGDGLQHD